MKLLISFGALFLGSTLFIVKCDDTLESPVKATVTLQHPNTKIEFGKDFLLGCNVSLNPQTNPYNVTFYRNEQPLGKYVLLSNEKWTYETTKLLHGLNLYARSDSHYPKFEVLAEPRSKVAEGVYQCSVSVQLPTGGRSELWSTNLWIGSINDNPPNGPPEVSLTYYNQPNITGVGFAPNHNFYGICKVNLHPNTTNYNVTLWMSRLGTSSGGQYIVRANQAEPQVTFRMLGSQISVNVFKANYTYPYFTLLYVPKTNSHFQTKFYCDIDVEVQGGKASYDSKIVCTLVNNCG